MAVMNVSEVMDKSIKVLKKNIKSIVLFSLGYGLITLAVILVMVIISGILMVIFRHTESTSGVIVVSVVTGILGIFLLSLYISSNAGIIKISSQEFLKDQVSTADAFKASLKSIPKIFCIVFIAFIMFLPVAGIFGVIIYFLFNQIKDSMLLFRIYGVREVSLIIIPLLVLLAAIFCVVAFFTWFCFVIQAVTIEKAGIIGSIKRSFTLVRNNFWKLFWCIILFNLTVFAFRSSIDSCLALLTTIFFWIEKFLNIQQDFITYVTTIFTLLRYPLSLLYWLVITPVGTIMLSNLYFNQRFKKEGYDLELRLSEIQKNQEREQLSEGV